MQTEKEQIVLVERPTKNRRVFIDSSRTLILLNKNSKPMKIVVIVEKMFIKVVKIMHEDYYHWDKRQEKDLAVIFFFVNEEYKSISMDMNKKNRWNSLETLPFE